MRKYLVLLFLLISVLPMIAMRYKGTVGKEPVVVELFYDSNGPRFIDAWGSVIFINVSNTPLRLEGDCVQYGTQDSGYTGYPFYTLKEYLQNGKYFAEWILETHGRTIKGEVKIYNGERLKVNLQRIK